MPNRSISLPKSGVKIGEHTALAKSPDEKSPRDQWSSLVTGSMKTLVTKITAVPGPTIIPISDAPTIHQRLANTPSRAAIPAVAMKIPSFRAPPWYPPGCAALAPGRRSSHARVIGFQRELPRTIARFFIRHDMLYAAGIFVGDLIGPFEVDHHRGRDRMAAGPVDDLHLALLQEVIRPHHIVEVFDLMVDVMDAGAVRGEQHDRMMHGVDAQEGRIAEPVRDARIAQLGPEPGVALRVFGVKPDMAEALDAGVAAGEIALAGVIRARDDFDRIARGIGGGNESLAAARVAFLARAEMHRQLRFFQHRADGVDVGGIEEFEADGLVRRIALEESKGVIARVAAHADLVAAEIGGLAFARRELQTDNVGEVADR